MNPSDDNGRVAFVDLIHRSMFYIALNDKNLQKALSDLKVDDPKLKDFFSEAVAAESRTRCYQDIANCSNSLEKGVSISKWDTFKKSGKDKGKGSKPKGKPDLDNDVTGGAKSKFNENSKTSKQATENKDKPLNADKPKAKNRYCSHCNKKNHDTEYCRFIPNSKWKGHKHQRKINKVDETASDNSDNCHEVYNDFGTFNSVCAVDVSSKPIVFNSFATKLDSHPLVTSEAMMTT